MINNTIIKLTRRHILIIKDLNFSNLDKHWTTLYKSMVKYLEGG